MQSSFLFLPKSVFFFRAPINGWLTVDSPAEWKSNHKQTDFPISLPAKMYNLLVNTGCKIADDQCQIMIDVPSTVDKTRGNMLNEWWSGVKSTRHACNISGLVVSLNIFSNFIWSTVLGFHLTYWSSQIELGLKTQRIVLFFLYSPYRQKQQQAFRREIAAMTALEDKSVFSFPIQSFQSRWSAKWTVIFVRSCCSWPTLSHR